MKKQPASRRQITRGMGTKLKRSKLDRSLVLTSSLPSKQVMTEVLSQIPDPEKLTAFEIRELERLTKRNVVTNQNGGNGYGQVGNEKELLIADGLQDVVHKAVQFLPDMVQMIKDCLRPEPDSIWTHTPIRDRSKFILDISKSIEIWSDKERQYHNKPGSHMLIETVERGAEKTIDEQIQEYERLLTGKRVEIKR